MKDIILSGVSKSFGETEVLNNLCTVFPAGKTGCITAPSGIGKTTLLRILMGLELPDSGSISGLENLTVGAAFQEDRLCENMTASANIKIVSPKLSDEVITSAMQKVGLSDCEHRIVNELSGGMRRRVAILRAILFEADLYLLDEPFKGLDADTKTQMISFIKEQLFGKSVILVTHDPEEAKQMNCEYQLKL